MSQEIKITGTPSAGDPMRCSFTVDRPIFPDKSFYFGDPDRAKGSPLVEQLFAIPGIESVLLSHDTVTVTKNTDQDWPVIGKQIGAVLRSFVQSGDSPVSDEIAANMLPPEKIKHIVQQVLDTQINPAVAAHGGFVSLIDVQGNTVFIEMGGGCQGCGMADVTLRGGIERAIREFVPEAGEILDTTDHAAGRNPFYAPSAK